MSFVEHRSQKILHSEMFAMVNIEQNMHRFRFETDVSLKQSFSSFVEGFLEKFRKSA